MRWSRRSRNWTSFSSPWARVGHATERMTRRHTQTVRGQEAARVDHSPNDRLGRLAAPALGLDLDQHHALGKPRQRSKRQRVAPFGSVVATPNTVWKVKR